MSFVIIQPTFHAKKLVEMVQSFHFIAIRFPFCLIKPQSCKAISESNRFYSLWHPFPTSTYSTKTVHPITTRAFKQSRTRKEKKRSIYTCMIFLTICLSDLVPLEHPFYPAVFAGINLSFMYAAILRNGFFPHVNSKFCRNTI